MGHSNHFGPKFHAISAGLKQEMNRSTAQLDLTASQSFFLGYLVHHRSQPIYQKDLEQAFDFSHPTVSGILGRLEAKGFVTFRPGEHDRRCKEILVTDKAIECYQTMLRHMMETETKVSAGLSSDEQAELSRLLDKIISNLGVTCCPKLPHPDKEELP